jgi:hypothetical protein
MRLLWAATASLVLAGCAPVQAWERGNLARPEMSREPHPEQRALRDHIHASREAGAAGVAAQSGGCGCY